jgi:hypothetical protein
MMCLKRWEFLLVWTGHFNPLVVMKLKLQVQPTNEVFLIYGILICLHASRLAACEEFKGLYSAPRPALQRYLKIRK